MATTLDLMEYSSDALSQAAYVTSGSGVIDQQEATDVTSERALGDVSNVEYRQMQSFQLSTTLAVCQVDMYFDTTYGSPSGNVTLRIETDNAGENSTTLANANATKALASITQDSWNSFTFATPFVLTGSTTYWLVLACDNQATNVRWSCGYDITGEYANGNMGERVDGVWANWADWDNGFKVYVNTLQCFSEDTIVEQGTYSLKGIAKQTDSLNDTLTRTVDPTIDLSGLGEIKYDIYAGRTGSNIKIGIHDSGGTTTEHTASISSAGAWETQTWNLSGVSNANRDAIDSIIITIVNADADNTFYIDNLLGQAFGINVHDCGETSDIVGG